MHRMGQRNVWVNLAREAFTKDKVTFEYIIMIRTFKITKEIQGSVI